MSELEVLEDERDAALLAAEEAIDKAAELQAQRDELRELVALALMDAYGDGAARELVGWRQRVLGALGYEDYAHFRAMEVPTRPHYPTPVGQDPHDYALRDELRDP